MIRAVLACGAVLGTALLSTPASAAPVCVTVTLSGMINHTQPVCVNTGWGNVCTGWSGGAGGLHIDVDVCVPKPLAP